MFKTSLFVLILLLINSICCAEDFTKTTEYEVFKINAIVTTSLGGIGILTGLILKQQANDIETQITNEIKKEKPDLDKIIQLGKDKWNKEDYSVVAFICGGIFAVKGISEIIILNNITAKHSQKLTVKLNTIENISINYYF